MGNTWWRRNSNKLALVFLVSGLFVAASAIEFPAARALLLSTYWTFFFAAVLLYLLSSERRVRATVSEGICADLAANEAAFVEAYDLADACIYVPQAGSERDADTDAADRPPVRLFVPRHGDFDLPEQAELDSLFVASNVERRRGLSFRPTGSGLFDEFTSMLDDELSGSLDELTAQLADGLTEGLELADRVDPAVRSTRQRIDFEIANSLYGPIDRFDHPIPSFLAVGLAVGTGRPVCVETTAAGGRLDCVVSCRLDIDDRAEGGLQRGVRGAPRNRESHPAPIWPGNWSSKNGRTDQEPASRSDHASESNEAGPPGHRGDP